MKLPIYLYGQPVLRRECDNIDIEAFGRDELKKLIDDMYETMYDSDGVGLAAPQIGRAIKLVVIDGSPVADSFAECSDLKLTLINPTVEVVADGERISRSEGCLSLPGLSEDVSRVEKIRLSWDDIDGVRHERELDGFAARIVQHECDHLGGVLYIDHISPIRKQLIRRKLNNIVEGRVRCDYAVRYAPRRK